MQPPPPPRQLLRPLCVMNYSSVCCWRQVAGWLQRLLPLHHCCCLISSTNSKLVTVPQGLVSLLLAQHYSSTQGRLQHTILTKQIHAAQMRKNISRQPVKYLNTKKYFCGRPLTLKVRLSAAMWQPWRCAMVQWLPQACYWAPGAG